MTKKDLERRNKFLLLQIKIIRELLSDTEGMERDELFRRIGNADYYTDPEKIKENLRFIEERDLEYNFYRKLMNVNEYED